MKLGLLGYPLGHSVSKDIHTFFLQDIQYDYYEKKGKELKEFFAERSFDGLNVTIPYKERVISYLDALDSVASSVHAVNTIYRKDGKLAGTNTDVSGFQTMLEHSGIAVTGKKCAVLGSGGASKAVSYALKKLGAMPITVSRQKKEGCITYEMLYEREEDFSVIVNTTPVGMKPNDNQTPVTIEKFHHLQAVIDIVANPFRTKLCFQAKQKNIPTLGGFEMLVRQAQKADEIFTGKKIEEETVQACLKQLRDERKNLVLIGMPTSGKSTIGKCLSQRMHRPLVEMDDLLADEIGMSIKECFRKKGESYFREKETDLCDALKEPEGRIISCGGGVIKKEENMQMLAENGNILFINRNLENLYGTDDRPLSTNKEDLQRLYQQRYPLYQKYADRIIDNNASLEETIEQIMKGEE